MAPGSYWFVSHLAAREKYSIPRALCRAGIPLEMYTDLWVGPWLSRFTRLPWSGVRYHPDLVHANIHHRNAESVIRRFVKRDFSGLGADESFDQWTHRRLRQCSRRHPPEVVFAYSYSCAQTLSLGRDIGTVNILGQINPGPYEARIVEEEYEKEFGDRYKPSIPSAEFWDRWNLETENADVILVNSQWSYRLLCKSGIPEEKLQLVPLVYDRPSGSIEPKSYPARFNGERPLRILYLGAVSVRKGFHILKRAMQALSDVPVVLDVVGRLNGPAELLERLSPNVRYHGPAPQIGVDTYYREADVFILPTLSDGFALTQLEAQYWKCPVIATPYCGEVVRNGQNGLLLEKLGADAITEAVLSLIEEPALLRYFSENALDLQPFSLDELGKRLIRIRNGKHL